jgi:hypothetical protein
MNVECGIGSEMSISTSGVASPGMISKSGVDPPSCIRGARVETTANELDVEPNVEVNVTELDVTSVEGGGGSGSEIWMSTSGVDSPG